MLLVHSPDGSSLYDCLTGERIARDDDEPMDGFDRETLEATGFGAVDGQRIRMAGLFGGALPAATEDGFTLVEDSPALPARRVAMIEPGGTRTIVAEDGECELRAFGFSQTGRSFIVATSCLLDIFSR